MPAFTRENLLFSFTFFDHCIPLLYPSDKNGHNVRIPFRCRCALSAFPPKRQAHFIKLARLRTLIDAGWGGGFIRFQSLLQSRGNAARRILRACAELRHADHRRTALGKHDRSESDPLSAVAIQLRLLEVEPCRNGCNAQAPKKRLAFRLMRCARGFVSSRRCPLQPGLN